MAKITKKDLIDILANKSDCSKKVCSDCLDTILETIKDSLAKSKDVVLPGFGIFKVSKRKARMGRNPQTGATIKIPAKKVPVFKAGKGLKDAVK